MSNENVNEAMAADSAENPDVANKFDGKKWGIIGAIAVVLIALIVGIGIYNTPANRLTRQLDLGNRYLEEQNYEQAIVEFDKAIAIDSMSVEAYLGKAQAYEGIGDVDIAIQTLADGYERTSDGQIWETWLSEQLGLAYKYLEEQNYEQAVVEFDRALSIDSGSIEVYLGKAQAYEDMGDVDVATQTLEDGYGKTENEQIQEEWLLLQLDLAQKYLEEQYYEQAVIEFDKAIAINQMSVEAYLGKAQAYKNLEDIDKAKQTLEDGYERAKDDRLLMAIERLDIIEWEDAVIEKYVRDFLGKPEGDIHISEVMQITEIYTGYNVETLNDLRYFTNLEELTLQHSNISDISALSGLTNLQSLYLNDNNINDLSVLSSLPKLMYLDLGENNLSDISMLSDVTNLKGLLLDNNNISDISALSGLTNLEYLMLSQNNISDISALSGLTNLRFLSLVSNNIRDVSALANLTNLEFLELSNNNISNISALSGLMNLEYLFL